MSTQTLIDEARYICTDLENNNNKFWHIKRFADHTVITEWGRVGDSGQSKSFPHSNEFDAKAFFAKKIREKEGKKGYTKQRTIEAEAGKVATVSNLAQIAKTQIQSDNDTKRLIDYLVKVNIHHIEASTNIRFSSTTGLFQTPLGVVTADGLLEAREILDQITVAKKQGNLGTLVNQYLRIIPQDFGRRRITPESLFPDEAAIDKQLSIIESLEGSLKAMESRPVDDKEPDIPQLFKVKLTLVKDGHTIDRIKMFYDNSSNRAHVSSGLRVKNVYEVEIQGMKDAYAKDGAKLTNQWELWHGTRAGNLLSIMKGGFVIPPSNAGHCTGRMFGNGVYFSDQSTKSLNYAYGYWGGGGYDNNCFMFLCDVAMGNYYVPSSSFSGGCKSGYDSTFAKGRQSGVANNEMIVYRTSQINPKYLCEFSK